MFSASDGQNGSTVRSRAHAQGSQGGEVPEKYYVVQNNEVLRLKYVLVYADTSKSKRYFDVLYYDLFP